MIAFICAFNTFFFYFISSSCLVFDMAHCVSSNFHVIDSIQRETHERTNEHTTPHHTNQTSRWFDINEMLFKYGIQIWHVNGNSLGVCARPCEHWMANRIKADISGNWSMRSSSFGRHDRMIWMEWTGTSRYRWNGSFCSLHFLLRIRFDKIKLRHEFPKRFFHLPFDAFDARRNWPQLNVSQPSFNCQSSVLRHMAFHVFLSVLFFRFLRKGHFCSVGRCRCRHWHSTHRWQPMSEFNFYLCLIPTHTRTHQMVRSSIAVTTTHELCQLHTLTHSIRQINYAPQIYFPPNPNLEFPMDWSPFPRRHQSWSSFAPLCAVHSIHCVCALCFSIFFLCFVFIRIYLFSFCAVAVHIAMNWRIGVYACVIRIFMWHAHLTECHL